jgi:RNA polymerase sigma-70 factor, ECF subfamily
MVTATQARSVHSGQSAPPGLGDTPGSWELISAAQAGDREAFGQLYQRYAPEVSRLVWSRTANRALAEDLTGETFARALRRLDSVSDQGRDLGAWLVTIARNLIADHYKSHRVQREHLTDDAGQLAPFVARDLNPEHEVINRETAAQLRAAVAALSSVAQRECLRLRFYEDRSVAEAATAMGREVGAVKALQHRALVALRARLTEPAEDPLARARNAVTAAEQRAAMRRRAAQVPAPRVAQCPAQAHADGVLVAGGKRR